MKKLLKSEICRSVNSALNPHMVVNGLKSQTFRLKKKKKKREKRKRLGSAFNPWKTDLFVWMGGIPCQGRSQDLELGGAEV